MAAEELASSELFVDSNQPGGSGDESEEDEEEEGSSETGSESYSGSEEEGETGESEEDDEEEDEPVLKYRRFAKEVVGSIGTQEHIRCIAVHAKVGDSTRLSHTSLFIWCALNGS